MVTPVKTSRLSVLPRTAPSMSVSRRSPTISGRVAPERRIDSRCSGSSGLPATCGILPEAAWTAATSVPLPGAMPREVGTVVSVLVAIHGHAAAHRVGRLGQVLPAQVGRVALDHDVGHVVGRGDRLQAQLAHRRHQSVAADHQDPAALADAGERHAGRGLRRGDDLVAPAWTPSSVRCSATASGVREALLVT